MDFIQTQSLFWVIWLLTVACGVIFIIKCKGTQSAVLGGIGFGLFVAIPILVQILVMFGFGYWSFPYVFDLLRIGGWVLLLIAFIKLPDRIMAKTSYAGPAAYASGDRSGSMASAQSQPGAAPAVPQQVYQWPAGGGPKFISKGLYIGSILGGAGASMLFSAIAFGFMSDYEEELAVPFWILAFLTMIYVAVMLFILVHRLWTAIQPGHPRTTPGKAVGFLFIPLFNLYWVFQAYYGWAKDYNRYVQTAGIQSPPVSENLGLTVSILAVAASIPYVGILPALVNLVFMGIFFSQAIDGANGLLRVYSSQSQAG
nr:hypothetical protein [candidate division Zixibacteria bacterium]